MGHYVLNTFFNTETCKKEKKESLKHTLFDTSLKKKKTNIFLKSTLKYTTEGSHYGFISFFAKL